MSRQTRDAGSPSHRPTSPALSVSIILAGFLGLWPAAGTAQTPAQMIQEFAETASGFSLTNRLQEGSLEAETQTTFQVALRAGADYMVVGFCDDDCTDLDLAVLDPSGEMLNSDYLPDAQPVLILTPERTGAHQVQVDMVACVLESCDYAVGILEGEFTDDFSPYGDDMDDRLALLRAELTQEGYVQGGEIESGSLDQGQEIRFPVRVVAGLDYQFVGVCDNDCGDFDLILLDTSGTDVGADILPDAVPIIEFAARETGEYRMAAHMVECAVEPCGFRIATFVKGEGLGPGGVALEGSVVSEMTHDGTLEDGDDRLREGEYFDEFTVEAQEGQTLIVDVQSPEFDTYLILETPAGDQERNDDWADDTMHSHIELVAPVTGTYSVLVTSFAAGEIGPYRLQIAVVEGGGEARNPLDGVLDAH